MNNESIKQENDHSVPISHTYWWRIYAIAAGTFISCLVWLPVWQSSAAGEMTQWIRVGADGAGRDSVLHTILTWINPIAQSLAAWVTMLSLLPVEASSIPVVLTSGLVMLLFFIWAVPILYRGLKVQLGQPSMSLATRVLGGFVLGAIAIFLGIAYFLGIDLTRGARYNFVYFPAIIVLLAAALSVSWNASKSSNSKLPIGAQAPPQRVWSKPVGDGEDKGDKEDKGESFLQPTTDDHTPPRRTTKLSRLDTSDSSRFRISGKTAVVLIWLMSLLSGITVVSNLGYQKYYRPDLFVPAIQRQSKVPVLIATTHNSLVQTGEMMGLAWEFKRATDLHKSSVQPQFLLAHQQKDQCDGTACRASTTLEQTLAQLPRPLDVWLVNFKAPVEPEAVNCFAEDSSQYQTSVNGYSSRLYHCLAEDSGVSQRL